MNDALPIRFDPAGLAAVNAIIAVMMFGAALELRLDDFRRVAQRPAGLFAGFTAQAVLTPAATCLLTIVLDVEPALALGMMLVAACPSGALSNVLTWRARGTVALSVALTTLSSLAATVLTPLNFALYAGLNPATRALLQTIGIPTGRPSTSAVCARMPPAGMPIAWSSARVAGLSPA